MLLFGAVILLVGCASRPPASCVPGQSVTCSCAQGATGVQICQSSGNFAACQCAASDAGAGLDAGGWTDAGAAVDGGSPSDGGSFVDGGMDRGTDAGFRGGCPDAGPGPGCPSTECCPYAELCAVIPDSGVPYAQCYSDFSPTQRPYCASCTFGGGTQTCGQGMNYCLQDPNHPGNLFCGADCSTGQACPNGYACDDVVVVGLPGSAQCSGTVPCPSEPAFPCTSDALCPYGGHCVIPAGTDAGACAGQCDIGQNQQIGFCACLTDTDCPAESCNGNECSISKHPCVTSMDCHFIHCVAYADAGGCLIGQNCEPAPGLSCLQVHP